MSKTSTVATSVTINGDGANINYAPPSSPLVNANAPEGGPVAVALSSGSNTIPVPPNARRVLLSPPSGSIVAKTFRSVSGDTGVGFTTDFQLFTVSGLSNIYLTATGTAETIDVLWL
jgi:hypothetical protein